MPTTRRSTRTDRHPCDQLSRPAARMHADGTAVPFPGPTGRGASLAKRSPRWYRGTHLVLMDAPRIHHETTTRPLRALSRQNRRSMGVSVEPEGGFEPPTCRLRGHRSPTTAGRAGKVAQLRKADRQGSHDSGKGGTLAETLAEQSRLSGTPPQFRPSIRDPVTIESSRLLGIRPQAVLQAVGAPARAWTERVTLPRVGRCCLPLSMGTQRPSRPAAGRRWRGYSYRQAG